VERGRKDEKVKWRLKKGILKELSHLILPSNTTQNYYDEHQQKPSSNILPSSPVGLPVNE
jgi:hypothetical protein